jgi:CHAT domain-containing protein/tetratricopeptide (TPR) repeat protein
MHQELLSALGGSVIYEECKGNFKDALRIADVWVTETRRSAEPDATADALLWFGIVHLLSGNPIEALDIFSQAKPLAGQDANRRLLIESFRWLACLDRYYTTPDGSSVLSTELSKRFDLLKCWADATQEWNETKSLVHDPDVLHDAAFVFQQLHNVRLYRGIADSLASSAPGMLLDNVIDNIVKPLLDQAREQAEAGRSSRAGYLTYVAGDLYRRGGNSENAERLLREAIELYRLVADRVGEALCLMTIGDCYCAPTTSPIAWNLRWSERVGDPTDTTLRNPTDTTLRKRPADPDAEALKRARECFRLAEQLFAAAPAPRGLAQIRLRQSYLAMVGQGFKAALRYAEQGSLDFEACGDQRGCALAHTHLIMIGIAMSRLGGNTDVIARWGNSSGSFAFALCLGFLLSELGCYWLNWKGDYERALAAFKAAHALYKTLRADFNTASAVADIGFTYDSVGHRTAAANHLEEAANLFAGGNFKDLEDSRILTRIMHLMMSLYSIQIARMDSDGMERSVDLLRNFCTRVTHIDPVEGLTLNASLSAELGKLPEVSFHQLLPFTPLIESQEPSQDGSSDARSPDPFQDFICGFLPDYVREQYDVTSVLAPLYRARREKEAGNGAHQFTEQALASARKAGRNRLYLEALCLGHEKRYDEAASLYKQHMAATLGDNTLLTQPHSPETLLQRQAILNRHKQAFSMLLRLKDYDAARQHLETVTEADGEEWWRKSERPWLELSDCGELSESEEEYSEALGYYAQAIETFEGRRSQLFRDELKTALTDDRGVQSLYLQAARACCKLRQPSTAFHYCERGKARALLDLMASVIETGADDVLFEDDLLKRWRERSAHLQLLNGLLAAERNRSNGNQQKVAELLARQAAAELDLNEAEAKLSEVRPDFFSAVTRDAQPLPADHVAELLPEGCLLLEYFVANDNFLSWAIDRTGTRSSFYADVDGLKIRRLIGEFHGSCSSQKPIEQLGEDLAELFLAPLADAIRGADQVIIVPYGLAHKLPFAALPFDDAPLIEHCPISYLPSASTLQFLHRAPKSYQAGAAIIVGNPRGNLFYAEQEALSVAALLATQALTRGEATRQALAGRLDKASLVHLATHSKAVAEAPLESVIELANGEQLTLYEMMGLRLRSDLVILSACETGVGPNTGGDEVFGFSRALLATGARSAIVTLWKISDVSTRILMERFYQVLLGRDNKAPQPLVNALRAAQLWLREITAGELSERFAAEEAALLAAGKPAELAGDQFLRFAEMDADERPFAHPYHWAAFTFSGL